MSPFATPPPPAVETLLLDEAVHRLATRTTKALWGADQADLPALLREARALQRRVPTGSSRELLEALQGVLRLQAGDEGGEAQILKAAQGLEARARHSVGYARVPELKALQDLCRLAGAPDRGWHLQLVTTRAALSRSVDPDLEREALALVKGMYGGWLEPPDRNGTLQACQLLADLWLRRPDATFTASVLPQAFPHHADGLWAYAAKHGDPALRQSLTRLLERLEVPPILRAAGPDHPIHLEAALRSLQPTPLQDPARRLAQRLLDQAGAEPTLSRRLHEAIASPAEQARFLEGLLAGPTPASKGLLDWAGAVLDAHPAPALARRVLRSLEVRWAQPEALEDRILAPALWAPRLERHHLWEEAEHAWRLAGQPREAARCLGHLGRWAEAREAVAGDEGPEADLVRAQAILHLGTPEQARACLERWLEALGPEPPRAPGVAGLAPLLPGHPRLGLALATRARTWVQAGHLPQGLSPAEVLGWLDPLADPPPGLPEGVAAAWHLQGLLAQRPTARALRSTLALRPERALPRLAREGWERLSKACEQEDDAEGALAALYRARELEPGTGTTHLAQELSLLAALERWKEAEARLMSWVRAQDAQPEPSPEAFREAMEGSLPLLTLLDLQGRHDEALALIRQGETLARRLPREDPRSRELQQTFAGAALARYRAQLALKARLRRLVPLG